MNVLSGRGRKADVQFFRAVAAAYCYDHLFESISYRQLGELFQRDAGTMYTLAERGRTLLPTIEEHEVPQLIDLIIDLLGLGWVSATSEAIPKAPEPVYPQFDPERHVSPKKTEVSQPEPTPKPNALGEAFAAALRFKNEMESLKSQFPNGTISISVSIKLKAVN